MARSGKGEERFSITIEPSPKILAQSFEQLAEDLKDWRPAWRQMLRPVFIEGVEKNLGTQGGSLQDKWPPLDPAYYVRKRRMGSRMTLKLTGRLRGSMRTLRLTKRLVSYGTTVPYARAVQYGKGRIGRRRFVSWSPEMKARATAIMNAYVEQAVAAAAERIRAAGGIA